jgi:alanine racemase
MDYVALDVTDSGTELGDTAVLLGRQGDEEIRVEELARVAGTGPYEVLCRFGLRLERRYL